MDSLHPLRPDENSVLSFDMVPELWLDDPDEEEDEEEPLPLPPKRHFANMGRLPAPDPIVPPPQTTPAFAKHSGEQCQYNGPFLVEPHGCASRSFLLARLNCSLLQSIKPRTYKKEGHAQHRDHLVILTCCAMRMPTPVRPAACPCGRSPTLPAEGVSHHLLFLQAMLAMTATRTWRQARSSRPPTPAGHARRAIATGALSTERLSCYSMTSIALPKSAAPSLATSMTLPWLVCRKSAVVLPEVTRCM